MVNEKILLENFKEPFRMTGKGWIKAICLLFLFLYSVIGMAMASSYDKNCPYDLQKYGMGSAVLYFLMFVGWIGLELFDKYKNHETDVVDTLKELPLFNIIILLGTFSFFIWGAIELIRGSCASGTDLFHYSTGAVIMQLLSAIVQYIFTKESLHEAFSDIGYTLTHLKRRPAWPASQNRASTYTNGSEWRV